MLSKFIIGEQASGIEALQMIDKNAKGIVYVCKGKKLVGSLTDGDIRRHIMKKGNIQDNVTQIMNNTPFFCPLTNRDDATKLMDQKEIRSIPIVDENYYIVDILFLNEEKIINKHQLGVPVVIMAGGKGTRLYPYTKILPKPLIPIGEKTITEHIISHFEEFGCYHFDMIVNYKKHFIKSYFLDNEHPFNVNFTDEEEFLGTGGGLKLLEGKYNETFFMTNCDILIDEDYAKILDFHKENQNIITMVGAKKNMVIPYGTIETSEKGEVISLNEKPRLSFITNTGFYVIEPKFLDMIPRDTFIHITDVIQNCINKHLKVGVYEISEDKWMDMGQMEEMEDMRRRLNIK